MNKLIVISGCSGGGKSSLLAELSHSGYSIVPEIGRELVKEQLAINSGITPWQNPEAFCKLLIERSIVTFHEAKVMQSTKGQMVFLDRCFLEGVSYYQTLQIKDAHQYDHFVSELRYDSTIFMTPPWQEIFCQDDERKHSFEDAVMEYERLLEAYPRYGYRIIELPKTSVKERVALLLSFLY